MHTKYHLRKLRGRYGWGDLGVDRRLDGSRRTACQGLEWIYLAQKLTLTNNVKKKHSIPIKGDFIHQLQDY
jgi:hypothetical protein